MVNNILVVHSSGRRQGSYSRHLVDGFVRQLSSMIASEISVVTRDLVADPIPHLQEQVIDAIRNPNPAANQIADAALSETLIAELKACDLLVIDAPMYNWGIPSALKAWIDHIVRIGYTFRYSSTGAEGLLTGKSAIVVLTRGGNYSSPEKAPMDFQRPYLDLILGVLGLTPEFVVCEGTLTGEENLQNSLSSARAALSAIATRYST